MRRRYRRRNIVAAGHTRKPRPQTAATKIDVGSDTIAGLKVLAETPTVRT